MKTNQQGIGAVGIIVVIAALGLVGFAGWYVAKENDKKNNEPQVSQQQPQTKSYEDSSKTYSLKVLSDWTVREAEPCCEGPAPDFAKVSRSVDFIPADKVDDNAVQAQADSGTAESKENWKASGGSLAAHIRAHWQDNKHTPTAKTINGNEAQYVKVHFKGDAEEYVDHQYLITKDGKAVYLTFREFHNHPMSDNVWNDAKHLDDFEAIVKSVSFN